MVSVEQVKPNLDGQIFMLTGDYINIMIETKFSTLNALEIGEKSKSRIVRDSLYP